MNVETTRSASRWCSWRPRVNAALQATGAIRVDCADLSFDPECVPDEIDMQDPRGHVGDVIQEIRDDHDNVGNSSRPASHSDAMQKRFGP
jgi:hypothetical protein